MDKCTYEIRVEGWLGDRWKGWFEGLSIQHMEGGYSTLTGVMDQAMLRGILVKIGDLGLDLVSIRQIEADNSEERNEAPL